MNPYRDVSFPHTFGLNPSAAAVPEDSAPQDSAPQDSAPEGPTPEDPTPEDPTPEDPTPEDPTPEDPTPSTHEVATLQDPEGAAVPFAPEVAAPEVTAPEVAAPGVTAPSAPGPAPLLYSTLALSDQWERRQQTDQSALFNPYAGMDFSSPVFVLNRTSLHQPESLIVNENVDCFLSADHANQSDASHPGGLSVAMEQCEFTTLDLECSICFSQFNNAFRCPKRLRCRHTFCLECLARMNVKSPDPSAILCPLCRALTPLPTLGLPKLHTDPQVLSRLPSSMQRVFSIRFQRSKGRLQLKRPDAAARTQSTRRSLDVGRPSPIPRGGAGDGASGEADRAAFRIAERPFCRVLLLTVVVMVIIALTAIVVYLLADAKLG